MLTLQFITRETLDRATGAIYELEYFQNALKSPDQLTTTIPNKTDEFIKVGRNIFVSISGEEHHYHFTYISYHTCPSSYRFFFNLKKMTKIHYLTNLGSY